MHCLGNWGVANNVVHVWKEHLIFTWCSLYVTSFTWREPKHSWKNSAGFQLPRWSPHVSFVSSWHFQRLPWYLNWNLGFGWRQAYVARNAPAREKFKRGRAPIAFGMFTVHCGGSIPPVGAESFARGRMLQNSPAAAKGALLFVPVHATEFPSLAWGYLLWHCGRA